MIISDKRELLRFKRAYDEASGNGEHSFIYCGTEVVTNYAKYVIEASEARLR